MGAFSRFYCRIILRGYRVVEDFTRDEEVVCLLTRGRTKIVMVGLRFWTTTMIMSSFLQPHEMHKPKKVLKDSFLNFWQKLSFYTVCM